MSEVSRNNLLQTEYPVSKVVSLHKCTCMIDQLIKYYKVESDLSYTFTQF